MDEQETTKETEKETTAGDTEKGSKYSTTKVIDRANQAAQRLEEANKKQEELIARQEEMMAKQVLGGTADAGQAAPEKKEETPVEYKN